MADKPAVKPFEICPPQQWGDRTPRSTELKKQVLDSVKKVVWQPKKP